MLLSPYHAGGQRPPAQVLRNSLPGHSRLAAISASWLVSSKVAPPVARVPIERFAGAHPSHFVGPFRSQGHGRPCLSIGTRATGSLLHGYLMQTKWCKKWHFFTPNSRLSQCTTVLQSMLRKRPRGGIQDATCGALERMSPTS